MKFLTLLLLTALSVSCLDGGPGGGGSSKKDKKGARGPKSGKLEGERKVTLQEMTDELKKSHTNQLNELYLGQTYEETEDKSQGILDPQTGDFDGKCEIKKVQKKTVLEFTEQVVKIHVTQTESSKNSKCQDGLENKKFIEVYDRKKLFSTDVELPQNTNYEIFRGFRNGKLMFRITGTSEQKVQSDQGEIIIKSKFTGLYNPNVSVLYADQEVFTSVSYKGKEAFSGLTKKLKQKDVDVKTLDRNLPEVYEQ